MKKLICIECPQGCRMKVDIKGGKVMRVFGNRCKKGKDYAVAEVEHPARILTSTVSARGLKVKMVPVRSDKAVPKERIFDIMKVIRAYHLKKSVSCGDVLLENVLGLGVNIIATRNVT